MRKVYKRYLRKKKQFTFFAVKMRWLLLLALVGWCSASAVRYDNYRVYRALPRTMKQVNALYELKKYYEFWVEPTYPNKNVDILVPPTYLTHFELTLKAFHIESSILILNVQDLIDKENKRTKSRSSRFDWESYQTLDQINDWLKSLEDQNPNTVTRIAVGRSYENRTIYGVKVSFKSGNRAVFLEGGIHAREWISPATVTYILNELLTSTDPKVRAVAESRDWYIVPNFNPDGYVYTHTTNRMWRKTTKPYGGCVGADPNRNWNYHWLDGGSSTNPCSETHAGSSAFSEIETKSISEYIDTIASDLDAYIAFHSYAQVLLIPFGHSGLEAPPNNDELHRIGNLGIQKLRERYDTRYDVDNIPYLMGIASGGSIDWVAGVHKVKMVYAFELRDTGRYGFLLPADQIIPTGQETLDGLVTLIEELNASQ